MCWNKPTLRLLYAVAALGLAFAVVPLRVQASSELEQRLRDQYKGKRVILRGFYQGDELRYDSGGMPTRSADPGDWTVDGFVRVTKLSLSGHRLTIQGDRLTVANGKQGLHFEGGGGKKAKSESRIRIEVEVDSAGITAEKAEAALSRIFLTSHDRLADLVPEYWKPCVLAASAGRGRKKYPACSFPAEFASIPGVVSSLDQSLGPEGAGGSEPNDPDLPIRRMEKGVKPPKVIFQKDPSFSEQARRAKYQGVVVMMLTVDKTGQARNLRIVNPLGFGLDQKAVESVSTWRFNPATRDGEPVDTEIAVEVDFHLY